MNQIPFKTALIIGAGVGISAALARGLSAAGLKIALASRNIAKLADLAAETKAITVSTDASNIQAMARLFTEVERQIGAPDVVVYNASARARGPIAELDPTAVERAIGVTAFGGFLAVHEAAKRMLPRKHGAILLTGASASQKGFPLSAAFAMGKFALRGLAQSAVRELGPQGIHVAHFIIDGGVHSATQPERLDKQDSMLNPVAIAETYMAVLRQDRSAWTHEVDLRPWVEAF
jgi:NAD(P)-dependent dehydrogenase (short-subunit alcohol dehydrogenase family)